MIEIIISLMLVGGLVVLLLSATGTLKVRNKSSYENIAAKWMGDEFTRYRNENFTIFETEQYVDCRHNSATLQAEFANYIPPALPSIYNLAADYPGLREGCLGREITDYTNGQPAYGNPNVTLVKLKLKVIWLDDNKKSKSLTNESIIYENGL